MTGKEPKPQVYTMPIAGGKPIGVPISVDAAFGEAVELTSERFPEVDIADILNPAEASDAEVVHWVLLLVLDGAGIKPSTLAKELKYKSKDDLLKARELAKIAIEKEVEDSALLSYQIISTKYHKFLRGVVAAATEELSKPIPQTAPKPTQPQRKTRPPALSREERKLITWFKAGLTGAEETLENAYSEQILDFIHDLGPDVPDEIIDIALKALKEHASAIDLDSPDNFTMGLFEKIKIELLTYNLDMQNYYDELNRYGKNIKSSQIKTKLDSATINAVVESANLYCKLRLQDSSNLVVPSLARVAPVNRDKLTRDILESFKSKIARNVKLSARMYERKLKKFHLEQFPPDKKEEFYSIFLEHVAQVKIDRYLLSARHQKNKRK